MCSIFFFIVTKNANVCNGKDIESSRLLSVTKACLVRHKDNFKEIKIRRLCRCNVLSKQHLLVLKVKIQSVSKASEIIRISE